jgi:hypothetical protein
VASSTIDRGEPYVETAFRTILFTDIERSTSPTERGDARGMAIVRTHDQIVEAALATAARRSSTPATA